MSAPIHGHFHRHAPKVSDQQETVADRIMAAVTRKVGTLGCAIVFCVIALISLPAALESGSLIIIVAWVAQTFLQLVLLSIILGGQSVAEKAADAQTQHMALGIDTTLDALSTETEGGLKTVLDAVHAIQLPAGEPIRPATELPVEETT
jgi:hypothetical protein